VPTIVFTDLSIRSLTFETRTDVWDAKTPGFGMRVGRRSKVFIAKVTNRRHTLGGYPDLTLAEARRKALALKSEEAPGRPVQNYLRAGVRKIQSRAYRGEEAECGGRAPLTLG